MMNPYFTYHTYFSFLHNNEFMNIEEYYQFFLSEKHLIGKIIIFQYDNDPKQTAMQ